MIQRYDLTYDVATEDFDITPVPESHEGRFVAYEDYAALEAKYSEAQRELVALRSQVRDASALVKQLHDVVATIGVDADAPKEEAWTVWHGGENPVPGKMVVFELRFGYKSKSPALSDDLRWKRKMIDCPSASDIIKYRVVKEG
ncbi:hypothetical protein WFH_00097 [Escherichia phage vB_EcoM_WFH]|uniref:Uncharacterized protein n=1 Tax=Escherichia phage vB_EcoM_WFH TaxID=2508192 RepID=A0A482MUU7_9CAUD|nr:hypothetical protein HOV51_gp098 [Escherichia phage vB_EcoM_WFH]QBQ77385.1 hypothetical protein WFH_00097 [Escherichia phage vB_EcoM_WFH]